MRIDLNADVGEGYDDRALMPFLTSVNVACGGHAGDERTMAATVEMALFRGIAVGAHPSYPDREHFGRRELALSAEEIEAAVRSQVSALAAITAEVGAELVHVKPHGALYNVAAADLMTARAIARAVRAVDRRLRLVGLAGSKLLAAAAEIGLVAASEAFADRRYAADGSLAPRGRAGAVIEDPAEAAEQALRIVRDGEVAAVGGARVGVHAETLCLHGDTPGAAAIARAVHERLRAAGVDVRPL